MLKKTVLIVSLVYFVFLGMGCSGKSTQNSSGLIDYSGKDPSGYLKELDYDIAVVNFFSSYCTPSQREIPDIIRLNTLYKDKRVVFIGASVDGAENVNILQNFITPFNINYPILYGVKSDFGGVEIVGLPQSFVLDGNGKILENLVGRKKYEDFVSVIDKHLRSIGKLDILSGKGAKIYDIKARFYESKGEFRSVIFDVEPINGYVLSGEGYPPVVVEFINSQEMSIQPSKITVDGVMKIYSTEIKVRSNISSLKGNIKCTAVNNTGSVVPVDEIFDVAVR